MKRNIVIPAAAVTAVLLLASSGVRESRFPALSGGFPAFQCGCAGSQGGPELELTAEFPDKAVPVSIALGELGGMNGTPVFVPADENYYKVWVDVSAQVTRTDVYRVDRRTGARELWNSTYATEDIQAVPEAVPVET